MNTLDEPVSETIVSFVSRGESIVERASSESVVVRSPYVIHDSFYICSSLAARCCQSRAYASQIEVCQFRPNPHVHRERSFWGRLQSKHDQNTKILKSA